MPRRGGEQAARIGQVERDATGTVVLDPGVGGERVLDLLSGEQLPRIC